MCVFFRVCVRVFECYLINAENRGVFRKRSRPFSFHSIRQGAREYLRPPVFFPYLSFFWLFPSSPPENLINLRQHTRAHTDMHVPHANKPYIPEGQSLHLNYVAISSWTALVFFIIIFFRFI